MDLKSLQDIEPWEWPPEAGKIILAALGNRQTKTADRLAAADLAGDLIVMNDQMADTLLSIVGNTAEPADLRAQAAISLGPVLEQADIEEFDDPEAVPIQEKTFRRIKQNLRKIYLDSSTPKLVRRRILEAAVRAQEEWHTGAIRTAWASDDPEWKLTAVFGMRHIRGFEPQILEALESADPEIQYEAISAAGNWELDAAWPHIVALLTAEDVEKALLLAAIDAVAGIRPGEAGPLLVDLAESDDEDVADAASEAMSMAEARSDGEDDDEDDEDDEGEDDEDDQENSGTVH